MPIIGAKVVPMDPSILLDRMSKPAFYADGAERVDVLQTHISFLFMTERFVYKVKKPVDFGFLDYSTLARRREMCEREVALNSRLCPDIYLGVVEIGDVDGEPVLGTGEVAEVAVKMVRLPADGMLRQLLGRGEGTADLCGRIARTLADFHARARVTPDVAASKGIEGVRFNCEENFEQTEKYVGDVIDADSFERIRTSTRLFLERKADLFAKRVASGRIRDGHGDVHLDSICVRDGEVCIFDCIEFNERFRIQDVAEEVAFLAMDLEFEGYDELAAAFVGAYVEVSGDEELLELLDFYRCYRAYVRAKINAFQLDDPHVPAERKEAVHAVASRYFALAEDYASRFNPQRLLVTCGLTGSGKSYLSRHLAARYGLEHVRSDEVRKSLLGLDVDERRHVPYGQGEYSAEMTSRTYEAMLGRAEAALAAGRSVVLDGCYIHLDQRSGPRQLAARIGVPVLLLECRTTEEVVRERLDRRVAKGKSVSDGRWEIYRKQAAEFEPCDEFAEDEHLILDRSRPLEELIHVVEDALPPEWR